MSRRVGSRSVFLTVITLFLAVAFSAGIALSQELALNPGTVASDGGNLTVAAEATFTASYPSRGSGMLAAGGVTQIPEAELNVPTMDEHLGLQTESIIGVDSRLRVGTTTTYPSRAIVYLYVVFPNTAAYSCTGWMIGPRTVATAGHCVYSAGDGGWATSIKAYPGRNGSTAPYGYRWGYRVFSPPGWTGSASQFYDYGAIQLAGTAIGNTTGWFGFRWQTSNSFPGYFTVRGYPGDKIGTLAATMWTMNGAVLAGGTPTTTYGKKLWYLMDTYGGQSGSPIYQTWGGQCCYGVGIHAYGAAAWPGPTPPYNSGTRITSAVFANLLNWRNWVYP